MECEHCVERHRELGELVYAENAIEVVICDMMALDTCHWRCASIVTPFIVSASWRLT